MDGELQITGRYHEQRDASPGEGIQERHPEGIGLGHDKGAAVAEIKHFAAVGQHDEQAGNYPKPVDPDLSFFTHKTSFKIHRSYFRILSMTG